MVLAFRCGHVDQATSIGQCFLRTFIATSRSEQGAWLGSIQSKGSKEWSRALLHSFGVLLPNWQRKLEEYTVSAVTRTRSAIGDLIHAGPRIGFENTVDFVEGEEPDAAAFQIELSGFLDEAEVVHNLKNLKMIWY